ncbi:hypothetical protein ITX54_05810 [Rouxiella silvae]|uniref:Uncharacterized protein n=1 Tax=Rouxiella silvae TaxID=1646373 RepID=A0AA41BVT6_9GAMM|nr:hypothetical protein [Rouxiella silvae]MBF6636179.1 hypothetical protein [Rouxiella silvae]
MKFAQLAARMAFFSLVITHQASGAQAHDTTLLTSTNDIAATFGRDFFFKEKHVIRANCDSWDEVEIITGTSPRIIIGIGPDLVRSAKWDGKEYSFDFDTGSMSAKFTPSTSESHLVIIGGFTKYQCKNIVIDALNKKR